MSALARTTEINCDTRAANEDCINGGSGTRTKYSYDNAGNTLSFTGETFTFNQRGRMSSATSSAGTTAYLYNALGQLIEKSGNGGTTLLTYDESGHILGEYSSTGALIQETVWMGDTPVATLQPNGSSVSIYYVHTDHLGTPRKITRPSDNGLMWRWDPDTFGSLPPNTNPSGLGTFIYNLRFPGQYSLNESGLFYNYFRDYDPQTGRYIESDPLLGLTRWVSDDAVLLVPILIRWPKWLTPYVYVTANPISEQDSFGMGPLSIIKCLWYGRQIAQAAAKCKGQCPDSIEGTIDFIQKYTNDGSLDSAMLKCTCKTIGSEKCAKWLGACAGVAIMAPYKP